MPTYSIEAPDGKTYDIQGPPGASRNDVIQAILARNPSAGQPYEPPPPEDESKTGFLPALKGSFEGGVKGGAMALAAKLGMLPEDAAELYIKEHAESARDIYQPTKKGWDESPWTKLKELTGGSLAYMGPAALSLAAAPFGAVAATGVAGLASLAQFTGSNLTRQMEEGSSLKDASLGAAALAAIPQAALDMASLRMAPGIRNIFGAVGKEMTKEQAEAIATQGLRKTIADYTLSTGKSMGAEGLTEAGQQVFERLQAGLSLTDEKAREEYLENFIGGAALGGILAPGGRFIERGRLQNEAAEKTMMPGQRPNESLEQAALRLQQEIQEEKLAGIPPPPPPPPPVSPIKTQQDLNAMPWQDVHSYINSLKELPPSPEIKEAIKSAEAAKLKSTEDLVRNLTSQKIEEASRALQPQPDNAGDLSFLPADLSSLISSKLANAIGFVQTKSGNSIFDQIVGKDITDPEQAASVIDILNKYKATSKSKSTIQNIDKFLESIPFFKPVTPAATTATTQAEAPSFESVAGFPGAESVFRTQRIKDGVAIPGSAYAFLDNGTTIRNRSGEGHRDKTTGMQTPTGKTVFVPTKEVDKISGIFLNGNIATALIPGSNNTLDLTLTEDYGPKKSGTVLASVPYQLKPAVGLAPVEIWDFNSPMGSEGGVHFGNVITEVHDAAKFKKPQEASTETANELYYPQGTVNAGTTVDTTGGTSAGVAGVPGTGGTAAGVDTTKPSGVVPTRTDVGDVADGEGNEPAPVIPQSTKPISKKSIRPAEEEVVVESTIEREDKEAKEKWAAERPERIIEKTEQLKNILTKLLSRMGLKNVAVKLIDDINSKAEGSYLNQLISIALDVTNPLRVLRHETIHALKELGFFSDSQWNTLVKQAKDVWIDKYLKGVNVEVDGKEMSRYDAYMADNNGDMDVIIEEAIADAFGDFNTAKAYPGMISAIMTKIKNFFTAIKQALNGAGFTNSEQASEQIFGKVVRGELKATTREGSITSGAQSSIQSGTQQGEASEQARFGEPAVRPGDRSGEGSDGRDEEKLSVRGGRSAPTGDGGGRDKSGNDTPLAGAPTVQGGGPNPELVAVAEKYAKKYGIPYKRQSEYVELNVDRAKRLAKAYLAMPNNPQDPKVKEAYADMIRQVRDQFDALSDSGYKFTFFDGETDPYDGNAWNAMRDLRATKTMAVYGTYAAYGNTGITEQEIRQNPMLVDTGLLWKDQNGIERMVTANDLFRAVHDAFGHGLEGAGFRAEGEENAWQAHAKLFYGPALKALTSETRGQNSEVNYGPNGEKNRKAKVFETDFADQKIGLMPDWTWKEGISKDEPVFQELDSRKDAKMFRNAVDRVKRGREYAFPLHVHDLETYQDARLFLSEDKESGFALIGDEIGSFFSGGGGQAYPTLRLAVEEGGRRIDAYRTKLPSVLGKAQFRPVARVEFNPEMATELWDFEKFKQFQNGNPDLVFYAYDPSFNPKGDLSAGDEAVAQTPLVEYEQAVELQVAATKYSLRGITLGTKQQDSVASSGVHYGKAKTDTLDASKYGTGLRGAESRRLETHWDNRIKKRVYFYIAKPDGTMPLPESGVGGYVYTQTFDNLAPPSVVSKLYSEARGDANTMESLIVDAGYDGYAVPKMGMMVVLNHNTPVEYQGTKAEYESKKQEKLSLRSVPLSTRGIMEANDAFARSELGLKTKAVRNRFNKVRDIAIALNRETLENQGQMNRKELTTDDLNTISRALADEVSYQLLSSSKTGTGLGWYSNNYPKAVKKLAKRFPELETNQHARAVFSALVAVTSNGEKVTKNISNAITLYAKLRDGKPLVAMRNRRATALINNLKQIEMLLAKYGTDFEKELKKEVTVADMNAYLRSVGKKADASYLANTRIPAAAIYFGPKLGAFYANLSGSEGYLTMDLWWTRTFNRMRGLLIPHATDASIDKFREMIGKPNATRDDILAEAVPLRDKYKEYGFNTELEHLVGKKEPDTKAGKIDWVKRARVVAEDAFDQLMYDNRLEKMANTIYKNEYEMLQEAPFSSSDRKFMYDAARRTQKMLQGEGIDLSLADIQAALWYYEKRLYGKLSGKKADDIGYEEAIIKQSSEGRGRTRPSVVFDRGVDTGNVSGGKSGTPDEVGRVPSGGTERLSLRVPGYLYHRSNLEKLASVENGDKFVLQPGPQGAEGKGVYFSQDEVVRETTAEGTARKPQTAVVVIKTPLRDGWYVSKTGKTIKYGKPRTWHTENKTIDLQAVDVKTIEGEKVIFAKPISSWVNAQEKLSLRAPGIRYSLRDKLGLYSELENKIEAVGPNQAPAPQWKTMIKGMVQKGVKPEEIEWSGVNDYLDLQEGKVSKAALLEYLKEGGVKVEETTFQETAPTELMWKLVKNDDFKEYYETTFINYRDEIEKISIGLKSNGKWWIEGGNAESNRISLSKNDAENYAVAYAEENGNKQGNGPKYNYGQLILPGGTNYREVLLKLPIQEPDFTVDDFIDKMAEKYGKETLYNKIQENHWELKRYFSSLLNKEDKAQFEKIKANQKPDVKEFKSGHWDQPNVLAHIRINDRVDVDGKKVLFVEEVQSDWGQEGKRKGFISDLTPITPTEWETVDRHEIYNTREEAEKDIATYPPAGDGINYYSPGEVEYRHHIRLLPGDKQNRYEIVEQVRTLATKTGRFPKAPFVTKTEGWLNLALKRIMVIAAEGNYDKVAFINGKQSAERYNLAAYIDTIDYEKDDQGTYEFVATDKEGKTVYSKEEISLSEIEELVGKDIAKKIEAGEGDTSYNESSYNNWHTLSNVDLEVGEGKGMKVFYDQIVPIALKKLLSKVGGKSLNEVNINLNALDSRQILAKQFGVADSYSPQPGFDVTPEMKQKVETTGLPKFSLRRSYSPQWTNKRIDSLLRQYAFSQNGREGDTQAYAALIKPKDFLDATSTKEYRKVLETQRTPLDVDKLKNEVQPIYLSAEQTEEGVFQIISHEGRHRMMALRDAGVDGGVPVVLEIRPFGEVIQNAPYIEEPYFKPQIFTDGQAPKGFYSSDAIPISYKHKKDLQENFGRESDIKFSLRSTMSTAANNFIDRTTAKRDEVGFIARITEAIAPTQYSKYRQQWLNRYNQLGEYDKARAKKFGGAALLADMSAEAAALMSDYGAGVTAAIFGRTGGIPVYAKGFTTVSNKNGKGPLAIFAPLATHNDPDAFRYFQAWMGYKRGSKFIPNATNPFGKEKLFEKSDEPAALEIERKFPEFKGIRDQWLQFNDGLVKYLVDTGVLTTERATKFTEHMDYIPFYRQIDGNEEMGPRLFQSLTGVKGPKEYKGSEAKLGDFLENIVRNVQSSVQMGIKNAAGHKAVLAAMDLNNNGKFDIIEPLPYAATGVDVVNILVNGERKYFRSSDPLWIQAVSSLNMPDIPFLGILAAPANLLRAMVTKDPGFMLANMVRDSLAAYTTSGVDMTPIASTLKNFAVAMSGKSSSFEALTNAGILGGHEFSKSVIESGKNFAQQLRKETKTLTASEKLFRPVTSIWDFLEKSTSASDAATRMEVYEKVLAKTNNEAEALFRAIEIMNFNRKGSSPIVRIFTAIIPFLNARVQGLDVMWRAATGATADINAAEVQKKFFIRGATIFALSCMYWTLVHDDDDYKKQEQETKDNYWLLPSLKLKVPIPFEVGVLFKVIPERIMALTFGKDTHKDFTESMQRQLISTFGINWGIPQVFKPALEVKTNYNFFTSRPIIGQGMEGVEAGYQVGPGTSQIAADIGKAIGYSPLKIDHLVNGYTGTMGMYLFGLMDSIYNLNSKSPEASKRFEQMPVLKRFLIDPEARGTVSAYYEVKNSTDAAVRTASFLERTMNYKEMNEYQKDNMKMLSTHAYVLDLEKTLKQFREMKLMIRSSTMDGDRKEKALTNLIRAENRLTANIQTIKSNIS